MWPNENCNANVLTFINLSVHLSTEHHISVDIEEISFDDIKYIFLLRYVTLNLLKNREYLSVNQTLDH